MEYKEVTEKIIGCAYHVYAEIVKQFNNSPTHPLSEVWIKRKVKDID